MKLHKAHPATCSEAMLDNVAKTTVAAPPCKDVNLQCAAGIKVGFITCATAAGMCDKTCKVCAAPTGCKDTNPKCADGIKVGCITCAAARGMCDKTCAVCGHRRLTTESISENKQATAPALRRRTQVLHVLLILARAVNMIVSGEDPAQARVAALNKVCCLEPGKAGSRCGKAGALTCDVDCAVVLLPLLKDCRPILDLFYDVHDKNRDGHASIFDPAYKSCLAIPTS